MPTESSDAFAQTISSIASAFEVSAADPKRVAEACKRLRSSLSFPLSNTDYEQLCKLARLLNKRSGEIARVLFDCLESIADNCDDPWRLLQCMLEARDDELAKRTISTLLRQIQAGKLDPDLPVLKLISEQYERDESRLRDATSLQNIGEIIRQASDKEKGSKDAVPDLYLSDCDMPIRRLAARVLDSENSIVSPVHTKLVLGDKLADFLEPYLVFTRATHLDLLFLLPECEQSHSLLEALQTAERECGETLLRKVIASLGWSGVNLGITVRRFRRFEIDGSLPLLLEPAEALLFADCEDARQTPDVYLFVAQGTSSMISSPDCDSGNTVGMFRTLNLVHADILETILDVTPLTRNRVLSILSAMDKIVNSYITLFSDFTSECTILADVYFSIKEKVLAQIEGDNAPEEISPELTRLVLMFEDPANLGEVSTLHGLKRYLHQRGLQLGFRLVETQRDPQRIISLALVRDNEIVHTVKGIKFSNFEPETNTLSGECLPFALELLVEALSLQLIYGQRSFPSVNVFCYGAEVHYYITFRNHPIFLRVDYSPPLKGGMADLQYYGVSQYELSDHPDLSLGAIRQFLEQLDFNVELDQVRIHARCDKERVLDLGKLIERISMLFHLIPYLMDLDWVIGSLSLGKDAKQKIAAAWAKSFLDWGSLPIHRLLTKDRLGILTSVETEAGATQEVAWNGKGNYTDRYFAEPSSRLIEKLNQELDELGLDRLPIPHDNYRRPLGLYRLKRRVFTPLRDALERGEIIIENNTLRRAPYRQFEQRHEVEILAKLLGSGDDELAHAVIIGDLVRPLERTLDLTATGSIDGHDVERSRLRLRDTTISLYVLRDKKETILLGMFAHGTMLYSRRSENGSEETNASFDYRELEELLRGSNYLTAGMPMSIDDAKREAKLLLENWESLQSRPELLEGERIVHGLKASRGWSTGRAMLGIKGREPKDAYNRILVLPTINPKQNAFVHASAGVISTGGSILSHAGLMAAQFRKPAMIVDGRWNRSESSDPVLLCPAVSYNETRSSIGDYNIVMRRESHTLDYALHDGDLVVLDANYGDVHILGQSPEILALFDALQQLAEARSDVNRAVNQREILEARGRRLHARHLAEKLLRRPLNPIVVKHIIHESLLESPQTSYEQDSGDRALLLSCLLQNPQISDIARSIICQTHIELTHRFQAVCKSTINQIPDAEVPAEIICIRLEAHRIFATLSAVIDVLKRCGIACDTAILETLADIDRIARSRLDDLRSSLIAKMQTESSLTARTRYSLRQLERLNSLLNDKPEDTAVLADLSEELRRQDSVHFEQTRSKPVLQSGECGYELAEITGWKAANLAEIDRLTGRGFVPDWFVVTDYAFQKILNTPLTAATPLGRLAIEGSLPLRQSITAILAKEDLNDDQKSIMIQNLWEHVVIPPSIRDAIVQAYQALWNDPVESNKQQDSSLNGMVAVRSSGCEEDTETNVRAGEFETFLYIRGLDSLLTHIKRTWSSLWTPRAIHHRSLSREASQQIHGGIIVQKIVESRISGVLLTVNTADYDMTQIIINVGLGMGEGIVSGKVATDRIIIDKKRFAARESASFRYTAGDKREQIVYDRKAGVGTCTKETLFHQRLRPAIEYSELQELADAAMELESAYRYPLDIEFAFEETTLRILQVRPVPSYMSDLRETIEHYPLKTDIPQAT